MDLRNQLFEELYKKQAESYEAKKKTITVTMPDGAKREVLSWVSTPQTIADQISKKLGEAAIVAKVDGNLWDMGRPLENDCTLQLLKFDDEEAKLVFYHSAAHVMGRALEKTKKMKMNIGPPSENGYFYEGLMEGSISEKDYAEIQAAMADLVKQKKAFERLVVAKEDAVKMFEYNEMKAYILKTKVPEGGFCTVYRCGDFVDPCRGPHVLTTGRIAAFQITKNSSAYYQGKADNAVLQRVYGVAFPNDKLLKEWQKIQEELAKRDHRNIGTQQELFMWHEWAPGCTFWYPNGAKIYSKLTAFMRREYKKRGYQEVICPNLYSCELWKKSGHWEHYSDNMFKVEIEKEWHALKPMNCPGHMLMFASRAKSYRDLPLRIAEFGVLHRNEASGALSGLTRVRRFVQDDSHIFITREQIASEVQNVLSFMQYVYGILKVDYHFTLSTRDPEKYLGDLVLWDFAEASLARQLNEFCGIPEEFEFPEGNKVKYDGSPSAIASFKSAVQHKKYAEPKMYWDVNPADAAFYGPKIDVHLCDALHRKFQCCTVQLDFVLPDRFKLQYVMSEEEKAHCRAEGREVGFDNNGTYARPVVVHRAILGSLERCIGILTEHYGGKWPFWMSPRQVFIVPTHRDYEKYAKEIQEKLHDLELEAEVDLSSNTFQKKIRKGEVEGYNLILVVGKKEFENGTVNIRLGRQNEIVGEKKFEPDFLFWVQDLDRNFKEPIGTKAEAKTKEAGKGESEEAAPEGQE